MGFYQGVIVLLACSFAAATPPAPIKIQSGFEFMGTVEGKVFVLPIYDREGGSDQLTYQDAMIKCTSAGYQMATVESAAQADLIKPYTCAGRWAWIDGVDFQTPDVFFSINTGKNLTYFEWESGRPILGRDDRNCMRFSCQNSNLKYSKMWDVSCTDSYLTVICQVVP